MKNEDEKRAETLALWRKIIKRNPDVEHMTFGEWTAYRCRQEAEFEDKQHRLNQIWRENGVLAPGDYDLWLERWGGRRGCTVEELVTYLRLKKTRGHKQRQLLEVWDKYYGPSRCAIWPLPDTA